MHQTNNARFLDLLWRHVLSLGLLAAALLVSYSRYAGRERPHPTACPLALAGFLVPVGPLCGPGSRSLWGRVGREVPGFSFYGVRAPLPLVVQSLLCPPG